MIGVSWNKKTVEGRLVIALKHKQQHLKGMI